MSEPDRLRQPGFGRLVEISLLTLFVLAHAIPVLVAELVPLVDYPGHLARYHIQLHLEDSPALQRWYDFEWELTGNLGVDLVMQGLGQWVEVETAARLIVAAIPPLFVAGLFAVAKVVHGRVTATAIAAAPLAYAYPFQFGFLNFSLALGLAMLAFGLWVQLAVWRWRPLLFVVLAIILYVCHIYGWAVLASLVAGWQAAEAWRGRPAIRSLLPVLSMAAPLPLLVLGAGGLVEALSADFFNWKAKLQFLLTPLRDHWLVWDLAGAALLYSFIAIGLFSTAFRRVPGLVAAAGLLLVFFILMPRILLGSILADMRLVPVLLAVALLAVAPQRDAPGARWLYAGAILFAILRLSGTMASFVVLGDRLERELAALEYIPHGGALVALFGNGSGEGWRLPRGGHLPSYAVVRRATFANDQFLLEGAHLLRLKTAPVPALDRDPHHHAFSAQVMADKIAQVPPKAVDALWIIDAPQGPVPIPLGYRVAWRSGNSAVFIPLLRRPPTLTQRAADRQSSGQ